MGVVNYTYANSYNAEKQSKIKVSQRPAGFDERGSSDTDNLGKS